MAVDLASLFKWASPRRKAAATSATPTFRPQSSGQVLTLPDYREYTRDIYNERQSATDARSLLELMFRMDPDVSAAANAYLTLADTAPMVFIRDLDGEFDRDAYKAFEQFKLALAHQPDLTQGYAHKVSFKKVCENLRYLALLRGACAAELVADKSQLPVEIRLVDPSSIRFYERQAGIYKPTQVVPGQNNETSLDIPTFFFSYFRASPLSVYPTPPFVAAINTIAARQQVINDLYRIMAMTGYPRVDVTVLEDVLRNAAPASIKQNAQDLASWINARIQEVQGNFSSVAPDQAFVHTDAIETKILNDKNPGVGVNVESIISVLNAQNQAGLKSVSTILGRGESGVNTASVESRIFALNADALNAPVAEILGRIITTALQLMGHQVFVEVQFRPAELRPFTELEPQLVMRQSRLLDELSLGTITDEEYHIQMHGRLPPEGAPVLSGTNFRPSAGGMDVAGVSPNSDPMGRSLSPEGSKQARSNGVKGKGNPRNA